MIIWFRQWRVKQALLRELEGQYAKFHTIYSFALREKARLEVRCESEGFENMDGVRTRLGEVQKQINELLKPFENKRRDEIPDEIVKKNDDLRDEKTRLDAWIDEYEKVVERVNQKFNEMTETEFHYRKVAQDCDKWLAELTEQPDVNKLLGFDRQAEPEEDEEDEEDER